MNMFLQRDQSSIPSAPQLRPVERSYIPQDTPVADIYIVDDERIITDLISEILEEEGYRVASFHDGASAFLEIIRHPPRLVLLDIGLPVMTGDEVLERLRQRGLITLPIIVMSAGAPLQRYRLRGATEILPKPFDIEKLLQRVRECISA
jgi:DNA-binding response OmpR family regulator